MVAFVATFLITILGVAAALAYGKRRPRGTPLTWGEAILAATYVFFMMFMAYGVVPHQWLDYADNELLWRPDRILLGFSSAGIASGSDALTMVGSGRVLVSYQVIRDVVASAIYGLFLVMHVVLWKVWQKRGKPRTEVARTSRFGRPLVRKATS